MGLIQTVAPASEPVAVADIKLHSRLSDPIASIEQSLIEDLVKAGRERCERVTGRQLVTATWRLTLDAWPCDSIIRLPRPPLQSVSSITYVDGDGDTTTISAADYQVDTASEPGRIVPAYGESWPSARNQPASITITYIAGYGTASAVPPEMRERIKAYVAYCYENREERDEEYLDKLFGGFWYGGY